MPSKVITQETRAILSAARSAVPIDTTQWFAYGVLDKERAETSCQVGYYNAQVYEVYRFYRQDDEWMRGERLEHYAMNGLGKVFSYTQKIANIYTGPGHNTLRDEWYVLGNQQSDGVWSQEEQYVTNLPNRVEFLEGSQPDGNHEHRIDWVGPWEWTRFSPPTGTQTSSSKNTNTEIFNPNDLQWYPAQQLKATYRHTITTIQVPSTPTLSSPADGAFTNPPITYFWNASSGGGTITYQLQVDDNSNFSSPFFEQSGISGTSKFVNGHANGVQYYWRVRASNQAGSSNWSNVWSHTVVPATPSVSASIQNNHPRLTWSPAAGATSYEIYKRTDTGSWNLYATTTSTSYTDNMAEVTGYQGTTPLRTPYVAYYVVSKGLNGGASGPSVEHYYDLSGPTPEGPVIRGR